MKRYEFDNGVTTLAEIFNARPPKDGTLEVWFNNLNRIPDREWRLVMKRIMQNEFSFPRNMIATVWKYIDRSIFDKEKEEVKDRPDKRDYHLPPWWNEIMGMWSNDGEERRKAWGVSLAELYHSGQFNNEQSKETVSRKMKDPVIRQHMNAHLEKLQGGASNETEERRYPDA